MGQGGTVLHRNIDANKHGADGSQQAQLTAVRIQQACHKTGVMLVAMGMDL
jgi:hypothetical protein